MDKTVENIKKFLHISPKKKNSDAKGEEAHGGKATIAELTVTTKVDVTDTVGVAVEDEEDSDYDGDRCESCK
jgi:hypothetical protein